MRSTKGVFERIDLEEVMRFGKNGKLSLRFIRPYEVIEKMGSSSISISLTPRVGKDP